MARPQDCYVQNFAPDQDAIVITVGDYVIAVGKEEDGSVSVTVTDNEEGSEQRMVLGQEGYTHALGSPADEDENE